MPKKLDPSEVATQLKWDIGAITDFCADALEAANDHNIAAALRALNAEGYELAKEFIDLEAAHAEAGELTPELKVKQSELMEQLADAEDEGEEEHECDDGCRSYGCPEGEGRR